jgi:hypothetical protein
MDENLAAKIVDGDKIRKPVVIDVGTSKRDGKDDLIVVRSANNLHNLWLRDESEVAEQLPLRETDGKRRTEYEEDQE